MASCVPISDPRLEEIRQETQADETMQVLTQVILQGWPDDKSSVPTLALPFFSQRDELTVQNGLIFRGERVVVPKKLRETEVENTLFTYGYRSLPQTSQGVHILAWNER